MQAKQPNRSSSSSWQDKTVDRRVVNTLFCGDFFHHVDDKVTLGDQLFSRVFSLKLPQPPHVIRLLCRRMW